MCGVAAVRFPNPAFAAARETHRSFSPRQGDGGAQPSREQTLRFPCWPDAVEARHQKQQDAVIVTA